MDSEYSESDDDSPIDVVSYIIDGDIDMVSRWLYNFDDSNVAKLGNVIFTAAQCGQVEICRLLVESTTQPKDDDDLGLSAALAAACQRGHMSVSQYLAETIGFDQSEEMQGALIASSTHGHGELVAWLCLVMGLPEEEVNTWILSAACARGDLKEVIRLAFLIGTESVDAMSHALRVAAYQGCLSVVDWLLHNTTADVGSYGVVWQGDGAVTALLAACSQGHRDVAKLLAEYATPSVIDLCSKQVREKGSIREDTAMHLAIWCDKNGWTILHGACSDGDVEGLSELVYKRIRDLNAQDNDGYTPLHAACAQGNLDIVRILLSVDADSSVMTDWGHTAEQLANDSGNQLLIDFLTYRTTSVDEISTASTNPERNVSTNETDMAPPN